MLIALGVGLGLLLSRNWHEPEPVSAVPAPTVRDDVLAEQADDSSKAEVKLADRPVAPPPREFKLPSVSAARPSSAPSPAVAIPKPAESAPKGPTPKVTVPARWLLRGTAPQNYDLLSDHAQVRSGAFSAVLKSHEKNIAPSLNGSLVQLVVAEPLLGKRLEVSAYLRGEEVRDRTVSLWLTAVDSNNLLLATENSRAQFPTVTSQWTRVSFVVDVPWSASQVSYGVSLAGKGTLWVDDLRLDAVDRAAMALTSNSIPRQLGQPVNPVSTQGPLPRPENLDFEETMEVEAPDRDKPPSSVSGIRQ